jgi:hypothetical protein
LTDDQVAIAGTLLCRFHEASRALAECLCQRSAKIHASASGDSLGDGPVICHNDSGPNNTVFREGRPIAFIDFDFAAVGDPSTTSPIWPRRQKCWRGPLQRRPS